MHDAGLKALPANDQNADGEEVPLGDIDPFSFLAGFNRGVKDKNRQALWKFLKDEWQLQSPVPEDFDGLPTANLQNSWMFPYAKNRDADHFPLLWEFFSHIMQVSPDSLDVDLMQRCLAKRGVGLAFLTMGMFWARPTIWLAADRKNRGFAESKGIHLHPKNALDYVEWTRQCRTIIGESVIQFSQDAHLWTTRKSDGKYGVPFNRLFRSTDPTPVLDFLGRVMRVLSDGVANPSGHLVVSLRTDTIRINFGRWAMAAFISRSDTPVFEALLPADHSMHRSYFDLVRRWWCIPVRWRQVYFVCR